MINILKYILTIIIIYLYIYAPPFVVIPVGPDKIIFLMAIIYITYKNKWNKVVSLFEKEFIILSQIFLYTFCWSIFSGNSAYVSSDFLLLAELIPSSYFIYSLVKYIKKENNIHDILIIISCIASTISIFLLLNPAIAITIKSEIIRFEENLLYKFYYRGYGLSDGLFFSYPVVQGLCIGLCLFKMNSKKLLYTVAIILILPSILVNARIGIIPVLIALIIFLIKHREKLASKHAAYSIIFLSLVILPISLLINEENQLGESLRWGMTFFTELNEFFMEDKNSGALGSLLGDMVVLPDTLWGFIWGTGEFIFTGAKKNTDVGYFLRLYFGGFIYVFLYSSFVLYIINRVWSINIKLACLLLFTFLICNYKADFFIVNPASRFYILLYVIIILSNPKVKIFENKK